MRQTIDTATADAGVMDIFEQALSSLKSAGTLSDSLRWFPHSSWRG